MEKELMINSTVVKELRKKSGWSQEQLANAAGLSLRTIQRVESESKASMETKICLAATFQISLESLNVNTATQVADTKPNRAILVLLTCSVFISAISLLINISNPISFIANLVAVFSIIYCGFKWYFSASSTSKYSLKSHVRTGFIFLAIFSIFGVLGNIGPSIVRTMFLSLVMFSLIFYLASKITQKNIKHSQNEIGS
jgi:DNA-binding XRE family transcriptional regulator